MCNSVKIKINVRFFDTRIQSRHAIWLEGRQVACYHAFERRSFREVLGQQLFARGVLEHREGNGQEELIGIYDTLCNFRSIGDILC
jgi:hypothetical protein